MAGCGSSSGPSITSDTSASSVPPDSSAATSGIHVDKAYFDLFEKEFNEVVECSGLDADFYDVAVFLYPTPNFPCTGNNLKGKICYGEFARPNKILLGDRMSWKHEVIHYLLYKNKGDMDSEHKSDLYSKFGSPPSPGHSP